MEMSYFANSQEMGLAGNLLYPNDILSSQQFYYEYNTDYLYAPQFPGTTTECSNIINFANQFDSVSGSQIGTYSPVSAEIYQPKSIEVVPFESSIFLSPPQTSPSSSAAQSPQAEVQSNDIFDDLPLDEIFNIDGLLSDDLLEVLKDVETGDFLKQLEVINPDKDFDSGASFTSSDSSATSTPKRKYSTDSSDCSADSFDTSSTISDNSNKKTKRARHPKSNQERASRKKDQNKKAATRYRNKKKTEMHSSEQTLEQLEAHQNNLNEQVKKLQTEFNVILPLAQAAFTFDPIRREHLIQLISRINTLL